MAIRVAHIATGNVGRLALGELIENSAFELTGVRVRAPEKVGRDAGTMSHPPVDEPVVIQISVDEPGYPIPILAYGPPLTYCDKHTARRSLLPTLQLIIAV